MNNGFGSDTSFATALGGGLDYKIIRPVAWRFQGDYVQTRFFGTTQNNVRLSTGIYFASEDSALHAFRRGQSETGIVWSSGSWVLWPPKKTRVARLISSGLSGLGLPASGGCVGKSFRSRSSSRSSGTASPHSHASDLLEAAVGGGDAAADNSEALRSTCWLSRYLGEEALLVESA